MALTKELRTAAEALCAYTDPDRFAALEEIRRKYGSEFLCVCPLCKYVAREIKENIKANAKLYE